MLISDDPQPAAQYLLYIRTLEKLNPQFNWRHIITALHWALYGDKDDASLLFAEGPENSGWNGDWGANAAPGVDLGWKSSTRQEKLLGTPRVMVLKDGRRVDMAHVYAGLRGGLNRWGPNRWVFERVNTTWGDNAQVAFHFVMDLDTGSSARWKPPQQALGNSLALVLGRILRDNPAMQLSEALEQAVGTI